jgi:hypothetical protein
MVAGTHVKVLTAAALFAAEIALAMLLLAVAPAPSGAQFFFDNRFPSQNYTQRGLFNWFAPARRHRHRSSSTSTSWSGRLRRRIIPRRPRRKLTPRPKVL